MRIAITGATGMIGSRLIPFLLSKGHEIAVITRQTTLRSAQTSVIIWDPTVNYIERDRLEGFDVIIHLCGSSIAEPWTPENKKTIVESRSISTEFLSEALARLEHKPKYLISASAIGFYGNHPPQEIIDEHSLSGKGFLADVCRRWEASSLSARSAGIRTVYLRIGVVLGKEGGALSKMLPVFERGLGGALGSGRQMMSWVALDEIPYIIDHLINKQIVGAVNVVSPHAVSNAEFTKTLGEVLQKPTLLRVPGFAIRLGLGEMGKELLLEGVHVVPRRLQDSGYQFRYGDLKEALTREIFPSLL